MFCLFRFWFDIIRIRYAYYKRNGGQMLIVIFSCAGIVNEMNFFFLFLFFIYIYAGSSGSHTYQCSLYFSMN